MREYATIIGGANVDIIGTPFAPINRHDSNPGRATTALGGVGRNIAENLGRLGVEVEFITVLGEDSYAKDIIKNCEAHKVSLEHSIFMKGEHTSLYLCINNEDGDMEMAISAMELYQHISPKYLESKLDLINSGSLCIVDTNIPEESLKYLMDHCRVPLFLDTVSTKKTKKIKGYIHNVHTLKPNIIEAEILSGMVIQSEKDLEDATDEIIKRGVQRIFLSMGPMGVYYNDGTNKGKMPAIPTEVVSTTGAGDSFVAATAWAYMMGFGLEQSVKAGQSASHVCISSRETVSPKMSKETIVQIMEENWR